jgi:hypothetical protein
MIVALFLLFFTASLFLAGRLLQHLTRKSRRIDADVLFLRSIPSDLDWREDGGSDKAQNAFLGKEDHTDQAVWSAAEYVANKHAGEMELTSDEGVTMRIRVEVVS